MKNYYKIFGVLIALVTLALILFEISSLNLSFQMGIEREQEISETANLRFANMLKASLDMLDDGNIIDDEQIMSYLSNSIYQGMENRNIVYRVYDKEKRLYSSRLLDVKAGDVLNYESSERLYTEYVRKDTKRYMLLSNVIEFSGNSLYVQTVSDITDVYVERGKLMGSYQLIVVIIFVLFALVLYFLTCSFEKNIRISEKMNQLEMVATRQEEFSAAFAHECKTPLTSIMGYSDMLRSVNLSACEQIECAEYIFEQSKRLERLTMQMMMLFNLRKSDVVHGPVDVRMLIEKVLKLEKCLMEKKSIEFEISVEKGVILAEYDLCQSMLTNILDNARKACYEHGKIQLMGNNRNSYYEIIVADNGCGMNMETIEKMMEPFYMADKARTRQEGGAGMGMTIVSKIADIFNIKIKVESTLGVGTTITLNIPIDEEVQDEQ